MAYGPVAPCTLIALGVNARLSPWWLTGAATTCETTASWWLSLYQPADQVNLEVVDRASTIRGMADETIRTALRFYLRVLKAHEAGIEPFFASDPSKRVVLTDERLAMVGESFKHLEKAKRTYYAALDEAGLPRPAV